MSWVFRTFLLISGVAFPLFLYVALRIAASFSVLRPTARRRAREAAFLVLAWLFALPFVMLVIRLWGNAYVVPRFDALPGWINLVSFYPFWTSLVIVVEILGPFLFLDIVGLLGRLSPSRLPRLKRTLAYARLGVAALALLYVPVRTAMDTAHIREASEQLAIKDLPAELENFRISLVGDVQVDHHTGEGKISQMHEHVRNFGPALLLSSGDVVTSGKEFLEEAAEAMCGMRGSVASVAVMGDHDFWSAPETVRDMQSACGWEFLDNRHTIIPYRGKKILISGLTHIYSERLKEAELEAFLNGAPSADIRILLAHQPAERVIHRAADAGYHLFLAGHTHGGQIVLHPFGYTVTPSMRETRYYSGLYHVGSMHVVVTNGVGLTLAPIRYHAPAEITNIVLTASPQTSHNTP